MAVDTATETKLETLRAQLPAVHASAYFNAGSFGPLPEPVFEVRGFPKERLSGAKRQRILVRISELRAQLSDLHQRDRFD